MMVEVGAAECERGVWRWLGVGRGGDGFVECVGGCLGLK